MKQLVIILSAILSRTPSSCWKVRRYLEGSKNMRSNVRGYSVDVDQHDAAPAQLHMFACAMCALKYDQFEYRLTHRNIQLSVSCLIIEISRDS